MLLDRLANPAAADDEVWHDEWECPNCRGGIYMDCPASEWDVWREGDVGESSPA